MFGRHAHPATRTTTDSSCIIHHASCTTIMPPSPTVVGRRRRHGSRTELGLRRKPLTWSPATPLVSTPDDLVPGYTRAVASDTPLCVCGGGGSIEPPPPPPRHPDEQGPPASPAHAPYSPAIEPRRGASGRCRQGLADLHFRRTERVLLKAAAGRGAGVPAPSSRTRPGTVGPVMGRASWKGMGSSLGANLQRKHSGTGPGYGQRLGQGMRRGRGSGTGSCWGRGVGVGEVWQV